MEHSEISSDCNARASVRVIEGLQLMSISSDVLYGAKMLCNMLGDPLL